MPIIKQAAKKLRHDRKRTKQNTIVRKNVRNLVKTMRKTPSKKALSQVFQALDKAAKTGNLHPNKVSRLKSRLSKLISKK